MSQDENTNELGNFLAGAMDREGGFVYDPFPDHPDVPPEWYHLPGLSVRVGAVECVRWNRHTGEVVAYFAGAGGVTLTDEQVAALKKLIGAP